MNAGKRINRQCKTTWSLAVLALCALLAVAGNAAAAGLPPYAPVKQQVCTDCQMTVPAEMVPARGGVISQGALDTPVGYWTMFDLDKKTLTRFITQVDAPTHKPKVVQSRSVALSDADLSVIVTAANRIWSLPGKLPLERSTDAVWGLDLFDGAVRRKEFGLGVIQGEGAELNNALAEIWGRLAR